MQPQQPQDPQQETWRMPVQTTPQAPIDVPQDIPAPQVILEAEPVAQPVEVTPFEPIQEQESVVADDVNVDDALNEPNDSDPPDDGAVIRWQATEYLHQDQSPLWFVVMGVVVVALMAIAYLWMSSITFAILIPVMAVALVVYVKRPPTVNDYTLSRKGLHINDQLYPFDTFKSFGVVSHNGNHSVVLVPRKRFQLGHTIYFDAELGEQIVDMFAARLPMKDVSPDIIDTLLSKLRL